jgi:hypothetical protein
MTFTKGTATVKDASPRGMFSSFISVAYIDRCGRMHGLRVGTTLDRYIGQESLI